MSADWEPARLTESDANRGKFSTVFNGEREKRENLNRQKLSHLFFVQCSLCQTTPNKEGATVITLFLPIGFSRVPACKTRQPTLSQFDPRRVHSHLRTLKTWPGTHFSRFGRVWPSLTKVDRGWPKFERGLDRTKSKIWLTTFQPLDRAHRELQFDTLQVENGQETRKLWAKPWKLAQHLDKFC